MDGWVIVGTKLDSKQLEKDLKDAERRLKQYEKEAEKLTKAKAKAEVDLEPYKEQKRLIEEMTDEMNQYAQTAQEIDHNIELEKKQLEELNSKYSDQLQNLEDINLKIKENAKNQGLVTNEIAETNEKLNQAKGWDAIKGNVEEIGKSMNKVLKKVAKWTLAVIGVRTAYNAIRNAISMVAGANDEVSDKLDYMKNGIVNALIPAVQTIVDFLYKLMVYVNHITKQLIGKELFDFSQSSKDSKETLKNLEKARKTLAGFDEMNVMSDTSKSAGGGESSQLTNPFESLGEIEMPKWLDDIVYWGQWIIDNWEQVVGQFLLIKLVIDILTGNWIGVVIDIIAFIILGVTQIWEALKDLWSSVTQLFDQFTTWIAENVIPPIVEFFTKLWNDICKGAVDMWNGIVDVFSTIGDWIYQHIIKPVADFFVGLWNGVVNGATNLWNGIKNVFKGIADWVYRYVIKPIADFFAGLWNGIINGVKSFANGVLGGIEGLLNKLIGGVNWLIKQLNKVGFDVPDWVPGIGGSRFGFNIKEISEVKLPRLAVGGLVNLPGKGVPVGGARTGEAGVEGVIPLTDSQAMETLGATIGKYININLTNITKLDNKQIAKEQKKINAQNDFAFNR